MKRLHLKDATGFSKEYLDWMMDKTVDWMVENRKSAFALMDWGKVTEAICVAPYEADVQRAENEGLPTL